MDTPMALMAPTESMEPTELMEALEQQVLPAPQDPVVYMQQVHSILQEEQLSRIQ